jgi:hypothetical protein
MMFRSSAERWRVPTRGLDSAVQHPPSECRAKADRAYSGHPDKEALDPVHNDPRGIAPFWLERPRRLPSSEAGTP